MEFRIFQILVSGIAMLFIINMITRFRQSKIGHWELILGVWFSLILFVFAIFPDRVSVVIAKVLGIESNINAVLFLSIISLFFFQLKMFFKIKRQDKALTLLARELALKDALKEKDV